MYRQGGRASYSRGNARGRGAANTRKNFFGGGSSSDLYAPAPRQAGQDTPSKEQTYIQRIDDKAHYHLDFCLPYSNTQGFCVKDYEKDPQRLAAARIGEIVSKTCRSAICTGCLASRLKALHCQLRVTAPAQRQAHRLLGRRVHRSISFGQKFI